MLSRSVSRKSPRDVNTLDSDDLQPHVAPYVEHCKLRAASCLKTTSQQIAVFQMGPRIARHRLDHGLVRCTVRLVRCTVKGLHTTASLAISMIVFSPRNGDFARL